MSYYYEGYIEAGIPAPTKPREVRDRRKPSLLARQEDYLLDAKVPKIFMGLGWSAGVDVDGGVALFDAKYTAVDVVWWKKLESDNNAVRHVGDHQTGEGDGDDERIELNLPEVPKEVHYLLFVVCVFTQGKDFSQVNSAYVRMVSGDPKYTKTELCKFKLSNLSSNAMLMCMLVRRGAWWNLKALGTPAEGRTIREVIAKESNLECLRQAESFPAHARRIRIIIVRAQKLAAKDKKVGLFKKDKGGTADPFCKVKYRGRKWLSPVEKSTLDPKWDLKCDLGNVIQSSTKAVKLTVWDKDLFTSKDFMGALWIPVAGLYAMGEGNHEHWCRLTPSKKPKYEGNTVAGEILVRISVEDEKKR